ncbi:MAG: CoA pyrophosphatase [Wenzhouxiangella sp.]
METEPPHPWVSRLSHSLFPVATPPDDLPVEGFRPHGGQIWRPRPSSVLVPIVLAPRPALILTVRSGAMASHPGQVALPGGGVDPGDAFPVGTALREAQEETGIHANEVKVLGLMRRFDTITGYRIVPVVGLLSASPALEACPREVLSIFHVPLERVLDPASYRRHRIRHKRRDYPVWSMQSERWPIWGATAAILAHLADLAVQ